MATPDSRPRKFSATRSPARIERALPATSATGPPSRHSPSSARARPVELRVDARGRPARDRKPRDHARRLLLDPGRARRPPARPRLRSGPPRRRPRRAPGRSARPSASTLLADRARGSRCRGRIRGGWFARRCGAMFARSDDPYQGADLTTSRRVLGRADRVHRAAVARLPAARPADRPDRRRGLGGGRRAHRRPALVGARELLRREVGFDALLAAAYVAAGPDRTAGLARGRRLGRLRGPLRVRARRRPRAPAAARGPAARVRRRSAWRLPLAYQGFDSVAEAKLAAEAVLLVAMAGVIAPFLFHTRRQRFQLERGAEVARRLARVDSLTGLANRRAFDEALTVEIARAERDGEPMSVALVDLDGLKRINDRFGHLTGDRVLARGGADTGARGAQRRPLLPLGRRRVRGAAAAARRARPACYVLGRAGERVCARLRRRATASRSTSPTGWRSWSRRLGRGPARAGRPRADGAEDREAARALGGLARPAAGGVR